jgi:hypothetical protein
LLSEAARFIRRKARKCFRRARSLVSRLHR